MRYNPRKAKFGRAYRDRLGHLSASVDGDVETYGAGWHVWPEPCEDCLRLVGRRGLYAWVGTIGHRERHVLSVVFDDVHATHVMGRNAEAVPLMRHWTPEPRSDDR